MLEIKNRTPFKAALVPHLDHHGKDSATLVVKATFVCRAPHEPAVLAEEQRPIIRADAHYGEPGKSSILFEADTSPPKQGVDVVVVGNAYTSARGTSADVELRLGTVEKRVRVFGERHAVRSGSTFRWSEPAAFDRMPIVWERAFGGQDDSHPDPKHHAFCEQNPIGVGFVASETSRDLEGARAPNIELAGAETSGPLDRPPPAGLGFLGRHWLPRRSYAGTYDDAWRKTRAPFLPSDFDVRFYNGAAADQIARAPLQGNEPLSATSVLPGGGTLTTALPSRKIAVRASIKGSELDCPAAIDTIVLDAETRSLILTFRATIPCGRELLYIDWVEITER